MFFTITTDRSQRKKYQQVIQCNNFDILLDDGWNVLEHNNKWLIYKGYVNDVSIHSWIKNNNLEPVHGNYCVIELNKQICTIKTNEYRSFPIWTVNGQLITNIHQEEFDNKKQVWADSEVSFDTCLNIHESNLNYNYYSPNSIIPSIEIVNNIHALLDDTVSNFLKANTLPLKIFLSGGLVSTLLYSYIKKFTNKFELVSYQHFDYDNFWLNNSHRIIEHNIMYKQIHHWKEPCVLVSGTHGDEVTMRSPYMSNLFLRQFGINLNDEIQNSPGNNYQTNQIKKRGYLEFIKNQKHKFYKDMPRSQAANEICNILINDFQHHHIGNTLTFTPLKNLKLANMFMDLSTELLIKQATSGFITKQLIALNDKNLLNLVATSKDECDVLSSLSNNFVPSTTKINL